MILAALCVVTAQRSFPRLAHVGGSVAEWRAAFFHGVSEKLVEESDFNSNSIGSMGESGAGAEAMFPAGDSMDMFLLQWEWPSSGIQRADYVLSEFKLDDGIPTELWRKRLVRGRGKVRPPSTIERYLRGRGLLIPGADKLRGLRTLAHRPLAACETNKIGRPYVFFINERGQARTTDAGEVGRKFPESDLERRFLSAAKRRIR